MSLKIAIIEDKKEMYDYYKRIITIAFPESTTVPAESDYNDFKKKLQSYFAGGISDKRRNTIKKAIEEYLPNDLDGLIIDYELERDKANIWNGINFYEHFIKIRDSLKSKPVFFVSGHTETSLGRLKKVVDAIKTEGGKVGSYFPIPANFNANEPFQEVSNRIQAFFNGNNGNHEIDKDSRNLLVSEIKTKQGS